LPSLSARLHAVLTVIASTEANTCIRIPPQAS
jgi:hypothetical protein